MRYAAERATSTKPSRSSAKSPIAPCRDCRHYRWVVVVWSSTPVGYALTDAGMLILAETVAACRSTSWSAGPRVGFRVVASLSPTPPAESGAWAPVFTSLEAGQLGLKNAVTENRSILLLHGVQSSQLTWWRLKEDLQDVGWQVQVADLLGHGSRGLLARRTCWATGRVGCWPGGPDGGGHGAGRPCPGTGSSRRLGWSFARLGRGPDSCRP